MPRQPLGRPSQFRTRPQVEYAARQVLILRQRCAAVGGASPASPSLLQVAHNLERGLRGGRQAALRSARVCPVTLDNEHSRLAVDPTTNVRRRTSDQGGYSLTAGVAFTAMNPVRQSHWGQCPLSGQPKSRKYLQKQPLHSQGLLEAERGGFEPPLPTEISKTV